MLDYVSLLKGIAAFVITLSAGVPVMYLASTMLKSIQGWRLATAAGKAAHAKVRPTSSGAGYTAAPEPPFGNTAARTRTAA